MAHLFFNIKNSFRYFLSQRKKNNFNKIIFESWTISFIIVADGIMQLMLKLF